MGATVEVVATDITRLAVDVVVNAANEQLQHGGGVALALADAGGPAVQRESDEWIAQHGEVGVGQAAVTTAGDMPARWVVHVVGPRWRGSDDDRDELAGAVLAALEAAAELGAVSVALPAISAGIFGGPLDECTQIIAWTALAWSHATDGSGSVESVKLVAFGDEVRAGFEAGMQGPDPLRPWPDTWPQPPDRPVMPDGYGVPTDDDESLRTWRSVEERLAAAETVWLASARPDGRPHVVPRWGVWLDNGFHYDGAPTTRHVRNIVDNDAVALHLESGTDVVILNGRARQADPPGAWWAVQLSLAFQQAYADKGYAPGPRSWDGQDAGGLCHLAPTDALAWASFPTDVTRWRW